jgi:hypothetical protein
LHQADATVVQNQFCALLADALFFLDLASQAVRRKEPIAEARFSKQVPLLAVMALEAAINAVLDGFRVSVKVRDQIDKFAILDKYDFFLTTQHADQTLNRGSDEVQSVSELVAIRNRLVHPRNSWVDSAESGVCATTEILQLNPLMKTRTAHLALPILPGEWCYKDAEITTRKTIQFLNYYFREKLAWPRDQCEISLCMRIHRPGSQEFGALIAEDHLSRFLQWNQQSAAQIDLFSQLASQAQHFEDE